MPTQSITSSQVMEAIQSLRQEVQRLSERVAMLETAAASPDAERREESVEDLLLTVSAAVAAYLGVEPKIRQIRLLHSNTWAQEGRATIQASHAITAHQF